MWRRRTSNAATRALRSKAARLIAFSTATVDQAPSLSRGSSESSETRGLLVLQVRDLVSDLPDPMNEPGGGAPNPDDATQDPFPCPGPQDKTEGHRDQGHVEHREYYPSQDSQPELQG